jgi:hypothetical protein
MVNDGFLKAPPYGFEMVDAVIHRIAKASEKASIEI